MQGLIIFAEKSQSLPAKIMSLDRIRYVTTVLDHNRHTHNRHDFPNRHDFFSIYRQKPPKLQKILKKFFLKTPQINRQQPQKPSKPPKNPKLIVKNFKNPRKPSKNLSKPESPKPP